MDRLSILRENCDDIALREIEWEPADVDIRGVAVVCMPRRFGWSRQSVAESVSEIQKGSSTLAGAVAYTAFSSSRLLSACVWRMAFMVGRGGEN